MTGRGKPRGTYRRPAAKPTPQQEAELDAYLDDIELCWQSWKFGSPARSLKPPDNWETAPAIWLRMGLPIDELRDLIASTMTRAYVNQSDKFRYLCGCAWNRAREIAAENGGPKHARSDANPSNVGKQRGDR